MADATYLGWPFFDDGHRALARDLGAWASASLADDEVEATDLDAHARSLVRRLGDAGWLRLAVPAEYGGARRDVDVRSLCLARDTLARTGGLADFAFAMQGLGSLPITIAGAPALREAYLPAVAIGARIAAFALSEPEAGSDVAAVATTARADERGWVLDGTKTWISNAGIADHYVVFARTGGPGSRGLSAFVVDADAPGLAVTERIRVIAPHPLGTLRFDGCRVGADRMAGAPGDGFRIAMATLDAFRTTVGAAALGYARRALDEALSRAASRVQFGKPIAEQQGVQWKLADMAIELEAARALLYRVAARVDGGKGTAMDASITKVYVNEMSRRVTDTAMQLHGAFGLSEEFPMERMFRDVRGMSVGYGTTEIHRNLVAREILDGRYAA